jgi:hypothetical protein
LRTRGLRLQEVAAALVVVNSSLVWTVNDPVPEQ